MTHEEVDAPESRYRRTLRGAALAIFALTPVELALQEHYGGLQTLALVACAVGLVGTLGAAAEGLSQTVRLASRVALVAVGVVALLGLWEHFEHNYEFAREIEPNLDAAGAAWNALFGASPPLAPGILALGAFLGWSSRPPR